jgi:recombination protein RecT
MSELQNVAFVIDEATKFEHLIDRLISRINSMIKQGIIDIPIDYSPFNAIHAAHMELRSNDKKPIRTCSNSSIAVALLKMVVFGLNPLKKQIDFIPYNNKLTAQPSYFGEVALLKRHCGIDKVSSGIAYEDDLFEIGYPDGELAVLDHKTEIENWNKPIIAAYCKVYKDGKVIHTEIRTKEQLETAWKESKNYGKVHNKFPVEMAKRTVLRGASKILLNTSDDYHIIENRLNGQAIEIQINESEENQKIIDAPTATQKQIDNIVKETPEPKKQEIKQTTKQDTKEEPETQESKPAKAEPAKKKETKKPTKQETKPAETEENKSKKDGYGMFD